MTACRNKASRAVTAALVGVLSVGAVPMVALAATDGAAPMASVEEQTAFSEAEVVLADDDADNVFNYTGAMVKPDVVSVTPKGGDPITGVMASEDYLITYVAADADGNPGTESVDPVKPGTYYVVIEAVNDSPYAGSKAYAKYTISGLTLTGASYYLDGDLASKLPVYDAEPVDIDFVATTGAKLVEGIDYSVKYYAQGEDWHDSSLGSEDAPTDAGEYYAHLVGMGRYANTDVTIAFTINPYVLNDTNVDDVYTAMVIGEDAAMPGAPTTVNGSSALASKFKFAYPDQVPGSAFKTYTPSIELVSPDPHKPGWSTDGNILLNLTTNSFPVEKVQYGVDFTYNGTAIGDAMTINPTHDDYLDWHEFGASYNDGSVKGIADAEIQVKVDNGAWDILRTLNNLNYVSGGTHTVTLRVLDSAGHVYGGSTQFKVVVTSGTLDAATSMYVAYDGTVISSFDEPYTGEDYGSKFTVSLYDGSTKLTEGTDYTWHFENANGETLAKNRVIDAGTYTIVVESDKYQLENATFDVTISKAEVKAIRLGNLVPVNGQYALAYNGGNPVTADWQYTTGERDADGKLVWVDYKGSRVETNSNLTVTTADGDAVKNIIEVGDYVASISAADTEGAVNYDFTAEPYEFSVAQELLFVDVTPDMYYYGSVLKAYRNNYIYGYNGGRVFGPTDSMSRADVAVVLYRMSGVENDDWDAEGSYVEGQGWNTGYVDCNNSAYYAEAVTWARKAGVVAGLDDTHFGPEQPVTREQFATMLANYAKARGQFKAADESVLDKYGDADQISAFARGTMAWAVEEGVMGGAANLMPTSEVTRADVAVMAINYQPVALWTPSN